MATDVERLRVANALAATLNDQRPATFDVVRVQAIVTGALGGEPRLRALVDRLRGTRAGYIADGAENVLDVDGTGDRWRVTRLTGPVAEAYRPPAPGEDRARGGPIVAPHLMGGPAGAVES